METKTSDFMQINWRDVGRGAIVATITAVLVSLDGQIEKGAIDWGQVLRMGAISLVAYLKLNLFTGAKTIPPSAKIVIFILAGLVLFSSRSNAQSFTQPVPKLQGLERPDSVLKTFRPVVAAAYAYPGNFIMTGVGAGYKHLKWDYDSQKWYALWSINGIVWAAGTTAPGPQIPAFAVGPTLGLWNDVIHIGGAYDFTNGKWIFVTSLSVPLNN